jgi:UDP-glucose 4-epimerase
VLDNLSVGSRKDLSTVGSFTVSSAEVADWEANLTLIEGDILDARLVQTCLSGADIAVHLAANTGVAPSVADPMADCMVNVIGTLNALEGCRLAGVKRFVFASSGAPLGEKMPPLHEEMAPNPASPYGASKLSGEGYCSAYFQCFGIQTVSLRFGNVYGEGSGHKQSVVAKFIKQAMRGQILEIYGDGSQSRDFIHISDLVAAIQLAATVDRIGGEIFQIATAKETTIREMTDALIIALESEGLERPQIRFSEKRVGDVMRNYSDTTKAQKFLNWRARVPLADGLRRTVIFFANQVNE